ncbi:MAG TPA: phage minor head protein, partial [Coleofasciculaceae cyanobacterium]
QSLARFAIEGLQTFQVPPELVELLNDRQLAQYVHQMKTVDDYGQWSQSIGSDGASYYPPEQNPYQIGDIRCDNCIHYEDGGCHIVEGAIDPQGICRLWIIPDAALSPFENEPPYVADSVRVDGGVIKWNGLDIGITHSPGQQRFPGSNPMRSHYGRIYRTWGQAEDGKAIDAYVAPDFNSQSDAPVYRVSQRDPATGMLDERKYFFGYSNPADVKRVHIYHAGADRFGAIEQVDPSELDAYRKDAIYHTDSCGCNACAAKAAGRSKRKKKVVEPEESSEEPAARVDAPTSQLEISDDLDSLIERSQQQSKPAISQWTKAMATWLSSHSSLEDAQKELSDDPVSAYKMLPDKKFEDAVYQSMLLADLVGRSQVIDEGSRLDSLSDSLPFREDAPKPEWFKLGFKEAIEYFKQKLAIPAESYKQMEEGYHDWAFSISQVSRADFLEDAKWLIDQALTSGNSFDTFQRQWRRLIGRKGWNPGERRLYTIFDTNIRSANGTGRGQQMQEVADRRPYVLWRWRDSPNPRLNHQKMDNKAIALYDPFWQKCRLPCGFGCRCTGFSVTKDYCDRNNIEILTNPPNPETIAEEGFRYPLAGLSDRERAKQIAAYKDRVADLKLRSAIG